MPMAVLKVCALCLWFCGALAHYNASKEDYVRQQRFLPNKPTATSVPVTKDNEIPNENFKLRHHSRFPKLDRVLLKIDGMHQQKTPSVRNRVRHDGSAYRTTTVRTTTTTVPDEDLFEDYGALVDEDEDENEYDDEWEEDDDADVENYEDDETLDNEEDPFSDDDDEWQAEEATEPPVQQPVSSITQYKWDNYGTRARVEESRRQQLHLKTTSEQQATNDAAEHYMKVQLEGLCRRPLPKVIRVQNEHPDPSKTYTPHCTILHRCAEDTGCCSNHETRCGPKKQVPVYLLFYTKTLGKRETKVEKLMFYNHTECECIQKSKTPSQGSSENSGISFRSGPLYPENIRRCKCPEEFTAKYRYDSRCTCDCEDHNQDCIRRKKGKEFFSLNDRVCIEENQCGTPLCEYGVYVRLVGRCQRKQEKLDSYRKLTIN